MSRRPSRRTALFASAALVAPAYFLLAVLLEYGFGIGVLFDPIDPVVTHPVAEALVLLGPVAAFVLTATAVLRVSVHRREGSLVGTVRLRLSPAHVTLLVVSVAMLITFAAYYVAENLLA